PPPLTVADAGLALAAAAAGLGQARVPELLARAWLADGRITAAGAPEPWRRGYWLVAPSPQWRQKKVKALVAHLTAEAGACERASADEARRLSGALREDSPPTQRRRRADDDAPHARWTGAVGHLSAKLALRTRPGLF